MWICMSLALILQRRVANWSRRKTVEIVLRSIEPATNQLAAAQQTRRSSCCRSRGTQTQPLRHWPTDGRDKHRLKPVYLVLHVVRNLESHKGNTTTGRGGWGGNGERQHLHCIYQCCSIYLMGAGSRHIVWKPGSKQLLAEIRGGLMQRLPLNSSVPGSGWKVFYWSITIILAIKITKHVL